MTKPKPLAERRARKAVQVYFKRWADDCGIEYHAANCQLRAGVEKFQTKGGAHVWVFRLRYGGQEVYVGDQPDGSVTVQRSQMERYTFQRKEIPE